MRILVAGFEHETNTFAPSKAAYENFIKGEGYPSLKRGAELFELAEVNLAGGGFIKAALAAGHEVIPVIWAGASASAHVTDDAFERIFGEIAEALVAKSFDAVFLNLHGAMATESYPDGEAEILARTRAIVGSKIPVVVSLDLHANVTREMLDLADGMVAYRTYPHLDMADTGAKVLGFLEKYMARTRPLFKAFRRLPFLIPINGMCTLVDPAKSVYVELENLEVGEVMSLSFAPGFPASDFAGCGPTVWGYGWNQDAVNAAVDRLHDIIVGLESEWRIDFLSPRQAVREAMRISASSDRPVVISDTQDNPGAGGDGNTTGMLRALLDLGAEDAALGVFYDPLAFEAAKQAGVGADIDLALGGTSGVEGELPFNGTFHVEFLGDGKCVFEGPMFNGNHVDLKGVACLRIEGVRIVVSATKAQLFDKVLYRIAGIEPEKMRILVNKSSVHFRADFTDIAAAILVAKAPGPMKADPEDIPWTQLAAGMRVAPAMNK
ncbi:microcystin degradation protein MlrC [Devosia sp. Root436]|uniref:M81 family metallopeptidase n=1 Tax=Devosia sp. Root436 TaxID=1736537 RepID=UPI0006F87D22|nr:M81 family metallopeptidase [Devosia sp. Root436]KQX38181.1 microcystin degradation protein MlrC [Devosia sp. Root436]